MPVDDAPMRSGRLTLLAVAIGGAFGALARDGVAQLNASGTDSFPTGTFLANITGAFGLGLLLAALHRVRSAWMVKALVGTGFFGAYTTFSTFAVEVVRRVVDDHAAIAVAYGVATIVVGLALATLGSTLGHRIRSNHAVSG